MSTWERWDVVPFESVGPVRAGMSREEVWGLFGGDEPPSKFARDVFPYANDFVAAEYEADGTLEAFEITCQTALRLCHADVPFHGSLALIATRLANAGLTLVGHAEPVAQCFGLPDLGIWMWLPDGRRTPKTVCVDLVRLPSRVGAPTVTWQDAFERNTRMFK